MSINEVSMNKSSALGSQASSGGPPVRPQSCTIAAVAVSSNNGLSESAFNLPLLDPSRWGWTASGGVAELIPPHERARRREAKKQFLKFKRKRDSTDTLPGRGRQSVRNGNENGPGASSPCQIIERIPSPVGETAAQNTAIDEALSSRKLPTSSNSASTKKKGASRDATVNSSNQRSGSIRFSSLNAEGIIDMHTYHRGREGLELRDEDTGDLLCDVEPTDTAYGKDAPNLVANVIVEFPLEDEAKEANAFVRTYRETISWDLGNLETPTPMLFASNIAVNFGLSYLQTLELSESIQCQLQSWVRTHCANSQPLILKDSTGISREPPPAVAYSLYGDVIGVMNGGQALSTLQVRKKPTIRAGTAARASSTSGEAGAVTQIPEGSQKAPAKRRREYKSGASAKLDAKCLLEVRRRLREESRKRIKMSPSVEHLCGKISMSSNVFCHVCQDVRENGGTFACGIAEHTYCDSHLSELYEITATADMSSMVLEWCPLCALECPCSTCTQRLEAVAQIFKVKTMEQGVAPASTTFDDLFDFSHRKVLEAPAKRKVLKKRKTDSPSQRVVPKLPYSEFPREVCNGIDMDPGTDMDYRTVYSSAGISIMTDATGPGDSDKEECPGSFTTSQPPEDGSIDYCLLCGKHGNLLCCDFCPRAFHSDCVAHKDMDDRSDSPWECPACAREKSGIPEEAMDGSNSLALICKAHDAGGDSVSFEDLTGLKILSIIHEMLGYLMNYSFGYVFKQPVDPLQVPAYSKIIEHPMDLGTISSGLEDGSYVRRLGGSSLHATIVAVLKDIELVWHNCFTFNLPGSAIFRMAEVQRKAAQRVQSKSFDSLLSEDMKREVQAFVAECARSRDRTDCSELGEQGPPGGQLHQPTKPRNKITVNHRSVLARARRPVAVLDPDTGMVVKIYTSLQAACAAIEIFRNLKHQCEVDLEVTELYNKVRLLVRSSSKQPKCRLFGYRWLFLDELRSGKVSFPQLNKPNAHTPSETLRLDAGPEEAESQNGDHQMSVAVDGVNSIEHDDSMCVEVVQSGTSQVFDSLEDSITQSMLSSSDAEELRSRIKSLPPNGDVFELAGRMWRKRTIAHSTKNAVNGSVDIVPELSGQTRLTNGTNGFGVTTASSSCIFKYDVIRGKLIAEFGSLAEAYSDWLMELATLSSSEHREHISLDVFQSLYLDGKRTIGGVMWTTRVAESVS